MEITIRGDPKEIAALVVAIQEQRKTVELCVSALNSEQLATDLRSILNRAKRDNDAGS